MQWSTHGYVLYKCVHSCIQEPTVNMVCNARNFVPTEWYMYIWLIMPKKSFIIENKSRKKSSVYVFSLILNFYRDISPSMGIINNNLKREKNNRKKLHWEFLFFLPNISRMALKIYGKIRVKMPLSYFLSCNKILELLSYRPAVNSIYMYMHTAILTAETRKSMSFLVCIFVIHSSSF